MGIYQSIRGFGKKALLFALLAVCACGDTDMKEYKTRNIFRDVNNDTIPDLLYLQPNIEETRKEGICLRPTYDLMLAYGKGDGTFGSPRKVLHFPDGVLDLQVKDIDNDGNMDILVLLQNREKKIKEGARVHPTYDLMVAKGDGKGNFGKPELVMHYEEKPDIIE